MTNAPAKRVIATHLPGGGLSYNRDTGGRDFWTKDVRLLIQAAARTGVFPFSVDELTKSNPRFDSPPYSIGDRIFLAAGSACDPSASADLTFRLGDRTYSSSTMFGEYSFGATQLTVHEAVGAAAMTENFLFGIGEGGRAPTLERNPNLIVQLATGVFGVTAKLLRDAAVVSIKMSQSAKIGQGGMLPKAKVTDVIQTIRGMPAGVDILSDSSRVFSIEEVRAIVDMVRSITNKPVFVKVGASHHIEFVAAGIARAGASGIIIDGRGGGTGAAPNVHRDYIGLDFKKLG